MSVLGINIDLLKWCNIMMNCKMIGDEGEIM